MKNTCNKSKLIFFRVSFMLVVVLLSLNSCRQFYKITRKRYPIPKSFNDTLIAIKNRFDSSGIDKYIIYSSFMGNCFGPSYSGKAKVFWYENESYHCRILSKKGNKNRVKDQLTSCNFYEVFELFKINRLDTVKTLPHGNVYIDPATIDFVQVKYNSLRYEKRFEHLPILSSNDTNHALYHFLIRIIKEE